nr:MAG TPA: hypothetical protein [Bacteriophage sp.]
MKIFSSTKQTKASDKAAAVKSLMNSAFKVKSLDLSNLDDGYFFAQVYVERKSFGNTIPVDLEFNEEQGLFLTHEGNIPLNLPGKALIDLGNSINKVNDKLLDIIYNGTLTASKSTKADKVLQVIKVDQNGFEDYGPKSRKVATVQDFINALEKLKDKNLEAFCQGKDFDFVYPEKITLTEAEVKKNQLKRYVTISLA